MKINIAHYDNFHFNLDPSSVSALDICDTVAIFSMANFQYLGLEEGKQSI